ncbi:MAG: MFS transporter [Anaerolineales bacterium]|nr:MFS transporter [Anaerolineales bacterium]
MTKGKLSNSIVWLYGIGELGKMLLAQTVATQENYFLTDVLYLPVALMGTILIAGMVLEVVSTPLVGIILEKARLPWGKYRSWLFLGSIPFAVFYALMFTVGSWSVPNGVAVVLVAAFLYLAALSGNLTIAAFESMLASLTSDAKERLSLSRCKHLFQQFGRILSGLVAVPLIFFISNRAAGGETAGYTGTFWILGIFCIVTFFMLGFGSKSRAVYKDSEPDVPIKEMFKQLLQNRPLLQVFSVFLLKTIPLFLIYGTGMYYFKYIVGDVSKIAFAFSAFNFVAIPGVFIAPAIARRLGTKRTYMVGLIVMGISIFLVRFIGGNATLFIILTCIYMFASATINVINLPVFAAAADYGEYMSGKPIRGMAMSMSPLAVDASRVVQQIVIAIGLGAIGYSAGVEVTPQIASGLTNMISIVPALFIAGAIIVMSFYKLTDERIAEIREALDARKEAASAA